MRPAVYHICSMDRDWFEYDLMEHLPAHGLSRAPAVWHAAANASPTSSDVTVEELELRVRFEDPDGAWWF